MEKQKSELSSLDLDVLDELVFTTSYQDLKSKIETKELKSILLKLLKLDLILANYPSPDEEVNFEIENFNKYFKEYYYLATKLGLKTLFG